MTDQPDWEPTPSIIPREIKVACREARKKRDRELSEWETKMEDEIWNPERNPETMTEPERPLRDRLLIEAGESFEAHSNLFLEAVDKIDHLSKHRIATGCHNTDDLNEIAELKAANAKQKQVINDWIGHPDSGMENTYESIVEKQQRVVETYRKCLAVAEGRLRQTLDTPNSAVLAEIANIKKEGGIG